MKKKLLLSSIAVALSAQVAALPALAADATSNQSAVNVGEVNGTASSAKRSEYDKKTAPLHQTLTNKQVFQS